MNVTHIITSLGQGGAETMLFKLINNQKSNNHIVICLRGEGIYSSKLAELGVKVFHLNFISRNSISNFYCVRKLLKKLEPDVVMSWMYHSFWLSLLLPKGIVNIWNVRHALTDLSSDKFFTRCVIYLTKYTSQMPDFICYNSLISLEQHNQLGYFPDNAKFIPNGFELEYLNQLSGSNKIRKEFSIDKHTILLVNVARYHPVKGHKYLIEAAKLLIDKKINIQLFCYGKNVDDTNTELTSQLTGYSNSIHLMGPTSEVATLLSNFDLYVSSSLSEAFPNVIGEAMLAGLPIVSTNAGDSKIIISKFGSLVKCGSSAELAKEIESTLKEGLGRFNNKEIREHIIDNYSINKIASSYQDLYDYKETVCQ